MGPAGPSGQISGPCQSRGDRDSALPVAERLVVRLPDHTRIARQAVPPRDEPWVFEVSRPVATVIAAAVEAVPETDRALRLATTSLGGALPLDELPDGVPVGGRPRRHGRGLRRERLASISALAPWFSSRLRGFYAILRSRKTRAISIRVQRASARLGETARRQ